MICPKCKSENVNIQLVAEKQNTGCLSFLLFGMFNLLKPTKTKTYAVCQSCGHKWETMSFANRHPLIKDVKSSSAPTDEVIKNDDCNIFFYRPSVFDGKAQVLRIEIDKVTVVKVHNGETCKISLPRGQHELVFKFYPFQEKNYVIVGDKKMLFDCRVFTTERPCVIITEK